MKAQLFAVLLLMSPLAAKAQLNDRPHASGNVESVREAREAIAVLIESLVSLTSEYDALHVRRVQLQTWVGKEQGIEPTSQTHRPHTSRTRAQTAIAETRVDMRATSHPEDLKVIQRLLQERVDELRAGMRAEEGSIKSLTVQLERLRNEDVPPMQ